MWRLQNYFPTNVNWIAIWILFSSFAVHMSKAEEPFTPPSDASYKDILMRDAKPRKHDQYLCTGYPVEEQEAYIYKFEAMANADTAHHMLLYGCDGDAYSEKPIWNCPFMCASGSPTIMFAWAKNAPPTILPKDVGLRIGKNTNLNTIVLQVHYAKKFEEDEDPDSSGIRIHTTFEKQPFVAGIFLLMSTWFTIPPKDPSYPVDMSCQFNRDMWMVPFAYRTHAHGLGKVITGYKYANGTYTEIGKGNPQWPQAFYPVKDKVEVKKGDYLAARCTYDSTPMTKTVKVGATGDDEMCNFYIMFYTDGSVASPYGQCMNDQEPSLTGEHFPRDVSVPLPPNPALEEKAGGHHHHHGGMAGGGGGDDDEEDDDDEGGDGKGDGNKEDNAASQDSDEGQGTSQGPAGGADEAPNTQETQGQAGLPAKDIHFQHSLVFNATWSPGEPVKLGQVGGVSTDRDGRLYIFHRGSRLFTSSSFSLNNDFRYQDTPIGDNVLVVLDKDGGLLHQFGAGQYFLPHGIQIDKDLNAWLTDVAMHQVFKVPLAAYLAQDKPSGNPEPTMVLGKRFKHGKDHDLFCKPADVAVLSSGEFYVADGYCNSRIVKFSKDGKFIKTWGQANLDYKFPPPPGVFNLPHAVTVAEEAGLTFVGDRENGRIQCFDLDGNFKYIIKHPEFGPRLFNLEFSPEQGGVLYAINGPGYDGQHPFTVQGFTLDIRAGELLEMWNTPQHLKSPHDLCVDPTSLSVYVGELNPSTVWKLSRTKAPPPQSTAHHDHDDDGDHHASVSDSAKGSSGGEEKSETKKAEPGEGVSTDDTTTDGAASLAADAKKEDGASKQSMTPSLIIGLLLVVPVVLLLIITLVIRAHKSGHLQGRGKKVFNLQGFLGNSHKGFDPLSTEESDHDMDQDDSDRDEYLAPRKIKTKS